MSQLTVIPNLFAVLMAFKHSDAAFSDKAGVIPVQWNQLASCNMSSQLKLFCCIVANDEFSRS